MYVEEGYDLLPEPDDGEQEMLDGVAAERRPNSRLGCQIILNGEMDGLVVRVPERQG
jgi:2Fe-2S ferredoxin